MKDVRVLGVDDSHFEPHTRGTVKVVGVVMRLSGYIDGFLLREITIDGTDATDAIISMVESKYSRDIRVIMIQGITLGGFNIVDLERLHRETGRAVITVSRRNPDIEKIREALEKHFPDHGTRMALITKFPVEPLENGGGIIYIQRVGITMDEAREIIAKTTIRGTMPEPIRIAHLVASALHFGESRGKP